MSSPARTITVDPEVAAILDDVVSAGRFASTAEALGHAVRTLDSRHRAVDHLNAIVDEALADMDDLVDQSTVRRLSRDAIAKASL